MSTRISICGMRKKLGFIGTGNMATALIGAVIDGGFTAAEDVYGFDIHPPALENVITAYGINGCESSTELASIVDVLFLSVKPQNIREVSSEISSTVGETLVVSIAAGINLKLLESFFQKVIRIMPNTPCLVGEMAAGMSPGKEVVDKEVEYVKELLSCAGVVFELDEHLLDAVTALSGSGPAFVAYVIDAFAEAAVELGIEKEVALKLSEQTAHGTGRLLLEKDLAPAELIEMVKSPGGTTEAGLDVLENSNVKDVLKNVIKAAEKRGIELSKE